MPRKALTVCPVPGCPELTPGGRCAEHQRAAEKRRGTAAQRGYGVRHRRRFRPAVLAKHPICVLCKAAPSVVADHHPRSRRELEALGLDADDPQYGRGLCKPCHDRETARLYPGGWHANQGHASPGGPNAD